MNHRLSEGKGGTHLEVVRSPVSSLAPAEAPSVMVIGFPPEAAKQTPRPKVSSNVPLQPRLNLRLESVSRHFSLSCLVPLDQFLSHLLVPAAA